MPGFFILNILFIDKYAFIRVLNILFGRWVIELGSLCRILCHYLQKTFNVISEYLNAPRSHSAREHQLMPDFFILVVLVIYIKHD